MTVGEVLNEAEADHSMRRGFSVSEANDVVISGMSCRLPNIDNMKEFGDSLRKSEVGLHANQLGKLDKFDAGYFGIPPKQAHVMDPQVRKMLEATYEAIIDAGINPDSLRGSKTGVFVGLDMSHAHEAFGSNPEDPQGYAAWGCTKSMFANRISYCFDLQGPSYSIQGSDASGGLALDQAYHSIVNGEIEAAIVAGTNLCLKTRCMTPLENDAVVVMFLQQYSQAKRVYATVLYSKSQISPQATVLDYPDEEQQANFLREVYEEANIEPETVEYVECHSLKDDKLCPTEVKAVQQVLAGERESPLLIGSVKSSPWVGNTASASGLVRLAKVLLVLEDGMISRTVNLSPFYSEQHKLQVVTEDTRTYGGYYAVNTLGRGGYHVHMILAENFKSRLLHYVASEKLRLCIYGSRTEHGLQKALKNLQKHEDNLELHALLNETARLGPGGLPYRGYCLLNHEDQTIVSQSCPRDGNDRPVWYVMSGMGSQWPGMGRTMMVLDTFRHSIHESDDVLQPFGVQLVKMIMSQAKDTYDKPLNSFIGIAAIQIALVNVLREMGIKPDGILGHSIGEIACAFADGCLTAKDAMLTAYWRGFCVQESKLPPGLMAAVGLTWSEALAQCPEGVVPACHNSQGTVTISGEKEKVEKFLADLREKKVFVREVNTAGVAFHSHHMQVVGEKLKERLEKIVKKKPRSARWISTCIPEDEWTSDVAQHCSIDYLVKNLTNPVLFQEGLTHIPEYAIVMEIGPHCLLQSILKRSLSTNAFHIGLMKKEHDNNVAHLFHSLGKCYMQGLNFDPLKIFPPVEFPVPRGTPMLGPLVSWDHSQSFDLPDPGNFLSGHSGMHHKVTYEFSPGEGGRDHYLTGHVIKEKALFPAAGYILMAWKTLARYNGVLHEDLPVALESIRIHRATILPQSGKLKFTVTITPVLGDFEIQEGTGLVCSGRIFKRDHTLSVRDSTQSTTPVSPTRKGKYQLTCEEVYKELQLRGYEYKDEFRGVVQSDDRGENGVVKWTGRWDTFLDTMMHLSLLTYPSTKLFLPTEFRSILINPQLHSQRQWLHTDNTNVCTATVNPHFNSIFAGGVCIHGADLTFTRTSIFQNVVMETVRFESYHTDNKPGVPTSSIENQLREYQDNCSKFALQSLNKLKTFLDKSGKMKELRLAIDKVLELSKLKEISQEMAEDGEILFDNLDQTGLLKFLEKMEALPIGDNFEENLENLLEAFAADIQADSLMTYKWDPNVLKPCLDTARENTDSSTLRILQVGACNGEMVESVRHCLENYPNLHLDLSTTEDTPPGPDSAATGRLKWEIGDAIPDNIKPYHLVVMENISKENNVKHALEQVLGLLPEKGFMLLNEVTDNLEIMLALQGVNVDCSSIEDKEIRDVCHWLTRPSWEKIFKDTKLELVSARSDHLHSTWFLLRKSTEDPKVDEQVTVNVSDLDCDWLPDLKNKMVACQKRPKGENLWLLAQNQPYSGIVGMVKCLRKEPGGSRVRCLFVEGKCPDLDITKIKESSLFGDLVRNDLVMNVHKDGIWGSYRHIPYQMGDETLTTTCASVQTTDKSSEPVWISSPNGPAYSVYNDRENVTCFPCFCSVSERDVAIATDSYIFNKPGKSTDTLKYFGMEFSGYDSRGQKVMGIVPHGAMSTKVDVEKHHLWNVPPEWTLAEASTVPVPYCIAYFALNKRANLQKHQSIMVHGTSLQSLAAITVALHVGSDVFVVMETEEKRAPLMERFGSTIKPKQLLNNENGMYDLDMLRLTKGTGVDVIFNPGNEILQKHFFMLKSGGYYFHSASTNKGTLSIQKTCKLLSLPSEDIMGEPCHTLHHMIKDGLSANVIKPFKTTILEKDRLVEAFACKEHTNNAVTVKIGESTDQGPVEVRAKRKLYFEPHKCYILTGGLGGFGLELAEWMIDRGASKLVLTSRSGVKTGYQSRKIRQWKLRGITVNISTRNIAAIEDTRELITESKKLGPVGGIFNLAMVLKDGLLESQTVDNFLSVFEPKVQGTKNLDQVTRVACNKTLDWFIVFSSISSGIGNIGQSNYGFANSVMERICEKRHKDSLPGMAIQWGAIADVGVVQATGNTGNKAVGGTLPQRLVSCLEYLELFMLHPQPVVTSFVPANQSRDPATVESGAIDEKPTLLDSICRIAGIKDKRTLKKESKLLDLGLDSLMSTEIRQDLERNHDMVLTAEEVRQLTIESICMISNEKEDEPMKSTGEPLPTQEDQSNHSLTNASWDDLECIVKLNGVENDKIPIYIVYGEDEKDNLERMIQKLDCPVYGVHTTCDAPKMSVSGLAGYFNQHLHIHNNGNKMILVGHRFGCPVAMEMGLQLDENDLDLVSHMVCIEGSHHCIPTTRNSCLSHQVFMGYSEDERENVAIMDFVESFTEVSDEVLEALDDVEPGEGLSAKIEAVIGLVTEDEAFVTLPEFEVTRQMFEYVHRYMKTGTYKPLRKYKQDVTLIRGRHTQKDIKISGDYLLSQAVDGEVLVHILNNQHDTFLQEMGDEVASIINAVVDKVTALEKEKIGKPAV